MGYFGLFLYGADGTWTFLDTFEAGEDEVAAAWREHTALRVDIHDSDFATVDYAPKGKGSGRFYVGYQPREYFDDPAANERTDVDREASAFSDWAETVLDVQVEAGAIRPFIADIGKEPSDDFVEETVIRLLTTVRLAVPSELTAQAE